MIDIQEDVALAPLTTLGVGGAARLYVEVHSVEELTAALSEAKRRGVGVAILGGGSNTLVPDEGVDGLVIRIVIPGIEFVTEGEETLLVAGAGEPWDVLVTYATDQALWGIENLAGIPGTVGAAPVQNIGAYGAELADVFAWADVVSRSTGETRRIDAAAARFGYRDSLFKQERDWVIVRVALRLAQHATPNISYKDLLAVQAAGAVLETPAQIAEGVRRIRSEKFPLAKDAGTAGSFFKNPSLSVADYAALTEKFPGLPGFPSDGQMKISLAWLLDHGLGLRGYAHGPVQLYERQPIVLVTHTGARAQDVDACATHVVDRVQDATGVRIEREVQTCNAS